MSAGNFTRNVRYLLVSEASRNGKKTETCVARALNETEVIISLVDI